MESGFKLLYPMVHSRSAHLGDITVQSAIFSAQWLLQPVSSPFTHNSLSPLSVFFGTYDFFFYSLDILFALRLTKSTFVRWLYNHGIVYRFNVDLLPVYPMALQPLICRAVQHQVAETPAHPVFPQCNWSRTAAMTVRTVATLPLAVRPVRSTRDNQ